MTLNLAVPPFDDVHVRRAVSFAIDKEAFVGMLNRLADQPADTQGEFEFISGEVATHIAADELERSLLGAFDPYPYDPSRALAEMRSSAYDQRRRWPMRWARVPRRDGAREHERDPPGAGSGDP